jgi:hypothetical protein
MIAVDGQLLQTQPTGSFLDGGGGHSPGWGKRIEIEDPQRQ